MSNLVGATTAVFPVHLSIASNEIINVGWRTIDGTAKGGIDYQALDGVVRFLPGEIEGKIEVLVYGGMEPSAADSSKIFYIRLDPPSGAILESSLLACKIIVDVLGEYSVVSVIVAEGRRGLKGEAGRSAYEQAVYMGLFTGTVEQWMQQIADASSAADRAENAAVVANSKVLAEKLRAEAVEQSLQSSIGLKAPQSTTFTKTEVTGLIAPKADKTYVDTALTSFQNGAIKAYPTLALANADIANIALDTKVTVLSVVEGGDYYKATAGATSLTKSPYDPLTQAKKNTDFKIKVLSSSTAEYQNFLTGYGIYGDARGGGALTTLGAHNTATSFIIPCLPETNYRIIKSFNSDRFRIAEFEQYPNVGDMAYSYPKDEYTPGETINPDGSVEFSFTTGTKTAYLVVYTSRDVFPDGLILTLEKKAKDVVSSKLSLSDKFYLNINSYDQSLVVNASLVGVSGVYTEGAQPNSFATYIIPVKPSTNYLISRSGKSNRFRIAEFINRPNNGDVALSYADTLHDKKDYVELLTGEDTNYLAVYVSNGEVLPPRFTVSLSLNIPEKFADDRIVRGKNLFDPQSMYDSTGDLVISLGNEGATGFIASVTAESPGYFARTAIIPVKPNTQYTIQKSASNRFRIGFCKNKPMVNSPVYIAKDNDNDSKLVATVETLSDSNYMVIVLSKNEPAPAFVQVEEGSTPTSKETFGFKLSPLAQAMDVHYEGFVKAGVGDGVTDDTTALKTDILMNSGVISFDPNKTYLISDTLEIDVARYHRLNGNGARFVSASPDKPCFRLKGSMSSGHSASPDSNNSYARQQYGFVFDHTIIYGQTVGVGIGIEVSGCLAPSLTNNNIFFLDKGIVFKNVNRDVNLIGNRIWVNKTYGIEFHDSTTIHQINIVSNIITYNTVNIIIDNADIYNIQITGNDIETASSNYLNTAGGASIVINAQTGLTEDVTIVGNTIEDHWVSDGMIVLNGANTSSIASVCIDGNSFGNSNDSEIKMGGCSGVYIGGQFKHSYGATLEATGNIDGLVMNVQSKKTGTKGGIFKCANASANLSNINISGSQLSGSARKAIDIVANQIKNFVINGNSLKDLNNTQAAIKIHAESVEGLRVDMNNISDNAHSKAIEITAAKVTGKNSVLFNSAKQGAFEAPEGFNVQGNW